MKSYSRKEVLEFINKNCTYAYGVDIGDNTVTAGSEKHRFVIYKDIIIGTINLKTKEVKGVVHYAMDGMDKLEYYRIKNIGIFVGFNKRKNIWCGYSPFSGMYDYFTVGSKVWQDRPAYTPSSLKENIEHAERKLRENDSGYINKIHRTEHVYFEISSKKDRLMLENNLYLSDHFVIAYDIYDEIVSGFPLEAYLGKGEWQAKTIDDAKFMAKCASFNLNRMDKVLTKDFFK